MNYEKKIGEALIMNMLKIGLLTNQEATDALKEIATWQDLSLLAA